MNSAMRAVLLVVAVGIIALLVIIFFPEEDPNLLMENGQTTNQVLRITSSTFAHNEFIPEKYSCDGENINPPLFIEGIPEEAVTLALLVDDPDIPQQFKDARGIDSFDHWTVFNIPVDGDMLPIAEGSVPEGAIVGENGAGNAAYTGACPPPDLEPTEHRYFFKVYALDSVLALDSSATKADVLSAMEGHILAEAELIGRYDRSDSAEEN